MPDLSIESTRLCFEDNFRDRHPITITGAAKRITAATYKDVSLKKESATQSPHSSPQQESSTSTSSTNSTKKHTHNSKQTTATKRSQGTPGVSHLKTTAKSSNIVQTKLETVSEDA
jgi:hypothetical protein